PSDPCSDTPRRSERLQEAKRHEKNIPCGTKRIAKTRLGSIVPSCDRRQCVAGCLATRCDGRMGMSAGVKRVTRRSLLAVTAAVGLGSWATLASAQTLEKVTYLFPAPPVLPAFGPIQLAKGKGYFSEAGLDVSFAVGRGGVDVAKMVGAGNGPLGGIVGGGPILGPRQRCASEDRGRVRRQRVHAARRARGFGHQQASGSQGQDHYCHVLPGHDVLCAARAARERRPQPE